MTRHPFLGIAVSGVGLLLSATLVASATRTARAADSSPPAASPSPQARRYERVVNEARERLAQAEAEYRQQEDATDAIQAKVRSVSERADASPASLQKAAARMDEEVDALTVEQAGAEARRRALEEAIAVQSKRAEMAVKDDPVAAELEKVVAAREAQFQRLQQLRNTGTVPLETVENAAAGVAEAKAKLAERRQQTATGAGGGALADWNRELLNLAIAGEERRAKLKVLDERRKSLVAALEVARQLPRQQAKLAEAEQERAGARTQLMLAEDDLRRIRATTENAKSPDSTPPTQPGRE